MNINISNYSPQTRRCTMARFRDSTTARKHDSTICKLINIYFLCVLIPFFNLAFVPSPYRTIVPNALE